MALRPGIGIRHVGQDGSSGGLKSCEAVAEDVVDSLASFDDTTVKDFLDNSHLFKYRPLATEDG